MSYSGTSLDFLNKQAEARLLPLRQHTKKVTKKADAQLSFLCSMFFSSVFFPQF